jgi:hypothetical protein
VDGVCGDIASHPELIQLGENLRGVAAKIGCDSLVADAFLVTDDEFYNRHTVGGIRALHRAIHGSAVGHLILHTLIVNCDLVGAPPFEYLRDVFGHLAADWPMARIRELLPAAWLANQRRQQQPSDRAADPIDDPVVAAAA